MDNKPNITPEQIRSLSAALTEAIPLTMSPEAALRWVGSKKLLSVKIGQILMDNGDRDLSVVVEEWVTLYKKYFGLELQINEDLIPASKPGLNRLIPVLKGLTLTQVLSVCDRVLQTHREVVGEFGDDLDMETLNDRSPSETYAIWIRDITESEVEPSSGSYRRPEHPPVPELTLLERLLFELKYFSETGHHLDTERVTCCFGTTHKNSGDRPVVCWRNGHLQILWKGDNYTDVLLSCSPYWSREVVE